MQAAAVAAVALAVTAAAATAAAAAAVQMFHAAARLALSLMLCWEVALTAALALGCCLLAALGSNR
jgi:hypothetical protein